MFDASDEYEFVELNRTFHELSKSAVEKDDIDLRRGFRVGKRLSWADLTQGFRVIVLSEAGSGKTVEVRHFVETLRKDGRSAYFLRLEHIPDNFEDAFEVGTFEQFKAWLATGDDGWLLLDSVDEARLRHPGDFERAILKLGQRIAAAQKRVHIFITGRPDAWRPKTDLDICVRHLPYSPSSVTVVEEVDLLNEKGPGQNLRTAETLQRPEHSAFKIVALDDLDRGQVETFAAAKGITNIKSLLGAVDKAEAWDFTTRPQDLEDLVGLWKDTGKIGGRLEIMENSVNRRLCERDQKRADARPVSPKRLREGVRLIAAAVTMSHRPTIRVPDGAANSKGIPIADILPDWDDKDRATLLSRPIFDEAIYGTVRFHHRSVREFLTAEWLADLLSRETSRRKIDALLFRTQYGLDVIVPTMRPVLPWLAIRDHKTLERLRKFAPEVLLEGGDPSKLPWDTRRSILRQVCAQIAMGASSSDLVGYASVQRFANDDIVADLKKLIGKYDTNEHVTSFLLRMISLGEMREALPEAKAIAVSAAFSKYTRIAAFDAVRAVGSPEDLKKVRAHFLLESEELDREWLMNLLEDLEPTAHNTKWFLACVTKAKAKEPYCVDGLADAAEAFVNRASVDLLPDIVANVNSLLEMRPVFEFRNCEISQNFAWLTTAAARAIENLIESRHTASLSNDALAILNKLPVSHMIDNDRDNETQFRISELVPDWPELNRKLFWYEVERALDRFKTESGQRLTEYWQVPLSRPYWRFGPSDFEYALEQITKSTLPSYRLLALSLAFGLCGRDRRHRARLKKTVADCPDLAESLARYLKPPTQGRRSGKQLEATWKRRSAAMKRKDAKNREQWQTFLRANPNSLRNNGLKPGQVSEAQYYVYERTREKKGQFDGWTDGNWKDLIEAFGKEVALAYRDGVIRFWRGYRPTLRSEGAPANTIPNGVIFGLTGLAIEANEILGWLSRLSSTEVELACRFASYELNGFPTWFPALFATYPSIVCDFLLNEIRYELSIEQPDAPCHYILYDLICSGQWAWNELASEIYTTLRTKEPNSLANLEHLLNIVQGSATSDVHIAKLASKKSKCLIRLDHAANWFAVWVGVDPDSAIPVLASRFGKIAEPENRTTFALRFITQLLGGRRGNVSKVRTAFRTPSHLKNLYLLMHQHIQVTEDVNRSGTGVFTPTLRDDAQDARERLAELLRNIPGKEAFIALKEISAAHPGEAFRPWFAKSAKEMAQMDADLAPWSAQQVRDFHDKLERTPENHRELAELAQLRLWDLKDDLENGDSSIAKILQGVTLETDMRKFIGKELRDKAFGRYSIPQEEELADAKRPDLRFHGLSFDGPVPCELKLAEKWTGPQLYERMENQLCGDYLRDNRSSRGIFVLVHQGTKKRRSWKLSGSGKAVNFDGLIMGLRDHWETIAFTYPGVDHVDVIGIDLTRRSK